MGFLCSWRSFSSAFKIFLLVLFFQNFYYGISVCISFCVYPIWTSVSFWMCWLLFFNTLGKFIDIISLKFFLLLFLFSGTPGVCMLVCVMMFHFLWGSIHFPPSFLLCFSACANSIFKFTHESAIRIIITRIRIMVRFYTYKYVNRSCKKKYLSSLKSELIAEEVQGSSQAFQLYTNQDIWEFRGKRNCIAFPQLKIIQYG